MKFCALLAVLLLYSCSHDGGRTYLDGHNEGYYDHDHHGHHEHHEHHEHHGGHGGKHGGDHGGHH